MPAATARAAAKKVAPVVVGPMVMIESATERYAKARRDLSLKVMALEAELTAVKRRRLAAIKVAVAVANDERTKLEEQLDANKDLFEKPRTRMFHGIKVGFRKLVGSLDWTDTAKVVELIEKNFPDQAEVLIKTTKSPVVKALEGLTGADLKSLGVTVGKDSDERVIKATDSDVDKLVDALLKTPLGEE